MIPERLLVWDALERRRRREGSRLDARIAVPLLGGIVAGALAGVARMSGAAEAQGWWLVVAMGLAAWVVMGGPWRVYWRPEASLLARLPLGGRALWALLVARCERAAVAAWVIGAIAATPLLHQPGPYAFARSLGVLTLGLVVAAAIAPTFAAAGGAIVASDQARRAVESMAGEFAGGPNVVWLAMIPAFGGVAAGGVMYVNAPWIARGGWLLQPAIVTIAAVLVAAGLRVAGKILADRWLGPALREVSALDAVKLAHVDLDRARGLEAVWGNAVTGAGRPIYRKDVALARRRFPAYYIVCGILVIASWIAAIFADDPNRTRLATLAAAGLATYTIVLGRRLAIPPIERPRLLLTLAIPPATATRAKQAYVVWRSLVPILLAVVPAIARSARPLEAAIVPAGLLVASILVGSLAARGVRAA